jgi:hypothetical protein
MIHHPRAPRLEARFGPKQHLARMLRLDWSRPLKPWCDNPPNYQDYDCADDCSDETRFFAGVIPPDRLAKVCCYKSSNNPEQGRQNKPLRLELVARMKESRDQPRHKSNYDSPKNMHCGAPSFPVLRVVCAHSGACFDSNQGLMTKAPAAPLAPFR